MTQLAKYATHNRMQNHQQRLNELCAAFNLAVTKEEKQKSIRELLEFIEGKNYECHRK